MVTNTLYEFKTAMNRYEYKIYTSQIFLTYHMGIQMRDIKGEGYVSKDKITDQLRKDLDSGFYIKTTIDGGAYIVLEKVVHKNNKEPENKEPENKEEQNGKTARDRKALKCSS